MGCDWLQVVEVVWMMVGKERGARLVVGSKRKKKPHTWIGISLKGLFVRAFSLQKLVKKILGESVFFIFL